MSLPIWSCSVWGLPCRPTYACRGALLPHPFTLTVQQLTLLRLAVCFLLHWPSCRLEAAVPDVIRHTALRSSDFPPPPDRLRDGRQRSSGRLRSQFSAPRLPWVLWAAGWILWRGGRNSGVLRCAQNDRDFLDAGGVISMRTGAEVTVVKGLGVGGGGGS